MVVNGFMIQYFIIIYWNLNKTQTVKLDISSVTPQRWKSTIKTHDTFSE